MIGAYRAGSSPVHRLGAGAKLVGLAASGNWERLLAQADRVKPLI